MNDGNVNTVVKIPSSDYMYFDLSLILYEQNIFSWNDKKYKKRIKRLLYIGLINLFSRGENIINLINQYKELFKDYAYLKTSSNINIDYITNKIIYLKKKYRFKLKIWLT